MAKAKEKRQYSRLGVYHLAKYRFLSSDSKLGNEVIASIKDISGGGVCLLVDENLPVSAVIELYIRFPHINQPVPCLVKIIWKRYLRKFKKYKIGAQFVEIENVLRSEIINKIKEVHEIVRHMRKGGEK